MINSINIIYSSTQVKAEKHNQNVMRLFKYEFHAMWEMIHSLYFCLEYMISVLWTKSLGTDPGTCTLENHKCQILSSDTSKQQGFLEILHQQVLLSTCALSFPCLMLRINQVCLGRKEKDGKNWLLNTLQNCLVCAHRDLGTQTSVNEILFSFSLTF